MSWGESVDHIGRVVPDIGDAMEQLSALYGLRWEPVRRYQLRVRDEGTDIDVEMAVCTSLDPPVRVELFEEAAGSPWTRRRGQPIHHICYWVEDRVAEASRLQSLGWRLEVTGTGPQEVNGFCYLMSPDGLRVEPKSVDGTPGARPWPIGGAPTAS